MVSAERIPARWEVRDERFGTRGDHVVERLYDGGRWLEGPAWSPAWRCLLVSDIPNDRVLRWDGATDVFRTPANFPNGRTIDRAGRVVTCEQGTRRVTRTEPDGSETVIADRWAGKRFNSPNDVVEAADGAIWFTDPSYGIESDYEGHRATPEIDGCHVYRCTPDGRVDRVADDFDRPNGLAFSAGGTRLHITDSARDHVRSFDVDGGVLRDRGVLAECDAGTYDGVRLDGRGRLWLAAHDGVHCVDPDDGAVLGKLLLPETCSNLTFGGERGNTLFVTATTSVYALMLNVTGAR